MSFGRFAVNDLVRIAAAGGGFELDTGRFSCEDLIRIAAAGSSNGSRLTFRKTGRFSLEELIRIGAAGGGCVAFIE